MDYLREAYKFTELIQEWSHMRKHTDQSLFEHRHLSMEPNSVVISLEDLSDSGNFATAIEFLFDVGHKLDLLHCQSHLYITLM